MHPYFSQALAAEHINDALRTANAARRANEARHARTTRFAALTAALRGTVSGAPAARVHVKGA